MKSKCGKKCSLRRTKERKSRLFGQKGEERKDTENFILTVKAKMLNDVSKNQGM